MTRTLGTIAMVGSALFWALGFISSKAVLDHSGAHPMSVLVIQLSASVAILTASTFMLRQSPVAAWRLGWTGLLEPGLAYQLSLAGLALTTASISTVLASLEPLLVPLLAIIVLSHKVTKRQLTFSTIALTGAIIVGWDNAGPRNSILGNFLVFGGTLAAALYVVVSSRHVHDVHVVVLAKVQQAWALALTITTLVVWSAITGGLVWPHGVWILATAGSGIVNYTLPFVLYLFALQSLQVVDAARFLALIPVFGLIGSYVLLGEPMTIRHIIGALMVVGALLATNSK